MGDEVGTPSLGRTIQPQVGNPGREEVRGAHEGKHVASAALLMDWSLALDRLVSHRSLFAGWIRRGDATACELDGQLCRTGYCAWCLWRIIAGYDGCQQCDSCNDAAVLKLTDDLSRRSTRTLLSRASRRCGGLRDMPPEYYEARELVMPLFDRHLIYGWIYRERLSASVMPTLNYLGVLESYHSVLAHDPDFRALFHH